MTSPNVETLSGLDKFLHPTTLTLNLITSSLFLSAYEMLLASIVDQVRSFYIDGLSNPEESERSYQEKVLALDKKKSPLNGSIIWLRDGLAIDEYDIETIDRIRKERNKIAHELPKILTESSCNIEMTLFQEIQRLVGKIDRWWIREIELPINGDFSDEYLAKLKDDDIHSGRMIFLQILVDVALGDPTQSYSYYEALRAAQAKMP